MNNLYILALILLVAATSTVQAEVNVYALSYAGFNITKWSNVSNSFVPFVNIPTLELRGYQQVFNFNSTYLMGLANNVNDQNQLYFLIDEVNLSNKTLIKSNGFNPATANNYQWSSAWWNPDTPSYFFVIDNSLTLQTLSVKTGLPTSDFPATKMPKVNNPAGYSAYIVYLPDTNLIYVIVSYGPGFGFKFGGLKCVSSTGCTYLFTYNFQGKSVRSPLYLTPNFIGDQGYPTYVTYVNATSLLYTGFDATSSYLFSLNPQTGATQIVVRFPTMQFPTSATVAGGRIYVIGGAKSSVSNSVYVVYDLATKQVVSTNNITGAPGRLLASAN
ncbi:hypothetical protein SAMD00019534_053110 [Acytostelium subglobosum LB1]|uniref:hypothetical protein n=1 Tax=Acytostelium subglobosum LB1 TaxID=1410327 RepID=UPI0006448923|nr:hypothetical protein SAMD00019534_053110 [Acytostelium subglobosum LB1]GAM22136.1 hypothetical protein SAMD00019534_053110 [Acytostelium subglobosum LB1]|eukprot:XP_012755236.1 hypothetical protein SAMD00019534_053110 [Acytostelium subglobosum LB1]